MIYLVVLVVLHSPTDKCDEIHANQILFETEVSSLKLLINRAAGTSRQQQNYNKVSAVAEIGLYVT